MMWTTRKRLKALEFAVHELAWSCNTLASTLADIEPINDAAAIRIQHVLDQERRRTHEIANLFARIKVWSA